MVYSSIHIFSTIGKDNGREAIKMKRLLPVSYTHLTLPTTPYV